MSTNEGHDDAPVGLRGLRQRVTIDIFAGDRLTDTYLRFAYVHVASQAGLALEDRRAVTAWVSRVETQPRFVNDLSPYPANAMPGISRSIYD
jgi:hypothetical protein